MHRPGPNAASPYYEYPRPEVVALIPRTARNVLELGCASGALAASLKMRQACRVTGLEYVESVAELARRRLDRVISGDCEQMDFELLFDKGEFDCIVAADVLEHLRDPEGLLRRLQPYLTPNATIVASIPNVRNYAVLRSAVEGYWTYQDAGILDRTHLRFFTRREIEAMFSRLGCTLELRQSVNEPLITEWERLGRPRSVAFGPLTINDLPEHEIRELFVIQWLVRFRRNESAADSESQPPVSVIVPTSAEIASTRRCVEGLLQHTDVPLELILVDSGSVDGTQDFLRSIPHARVILNQSTTFVESANVGFTAATGRYVVVLDADAAVSEGWLNGLLAPLDDDAHVSLARGQGFAFRRTLLDKTGGLDPAIESREDAQHDFCARAEQLQPRFVPPPQHVVVTEVTPALAAYHTAIRLLGEGSTSEAIERLNEAIAESPTIADFHNVLGAALFESGQLEASIAAFERAAELAPDDAPIRENLAEARAHRASAA